MTKERKFIAYWDCLGFECIIDCTSWERNSLLNTIAGKEIKPAPVNLHAMTLRARFNPQRSPEIWVFSTVDNITETELNQIAQDTPQHLVDLIRERGTCLYHSEPQKQVIV
jgi:hypothetical protein